MRRWSVGNLICTVLITSVCLCACDTESETTVSSDAEKITQVTVTESVSETTTSGEVIKDSGFKGRWHRTDCHSALCGTIDITDVDEEGFSFSGTFSWFAHTGEAEGEALFENANKAVYYLEADEDEPDSGSLYVYFTLEDDILHVQSEGDVSRMPMGMNVGVDGDYTLNAPTYTNADILSETYTDDELDAINAMIGEGDYEDHFVNDTEAGAVIVSEVMTSDGIPSKRVECLVPGLDTFMGYEILITEEGKIYLDHENGSFYTNDPDYKEEVLPTFSAE